MKIKAGLSWAASLSTSGTRLSNMDLRKRKSLIWRICVALIAVAVLFGAPVSHAAPAFCPTESGASIDHPHHGDHRSEKMTRGDMACCSSVCAVCILLLPSSSASSEMTTQSTRAIDLQDHLSGLAPSPDFEPPRSAA